MLSVTYAECRKLDDYTEFYYAECPYAECRHAEGHHAECHHAECYYADYHYAKCHYAECKWLKFYNFCPLGPLSSQSLSFILSHFPYPFPHPLSLSFILRLYS